MTGFKPEDLDRIFTYHAPKGDQSERYKAIRDAGRVFADVIARSSPPSSEQTLAIRKIEQAVMWANAGIARNE
jgi:hypothetical protein